MDSTVVLSASALPFALTTWSTVAGDIVPCSAVLAAVFASPTISSNSESMVQMMSTRMSPKAIALGLFSDEAEEDGRPSATDCTNAITVSTDRLFFAGHESRVADSMEWYTVVSVALASAS